jgi:ABC-type transport system involved in multi-copper enzyme maturation permease subunit
MTLTGLVLVIGAAVVCALINPSDIWSSSDTQDAANSIYMVFLSILASKVIIDDYQTGTIVVAVATVRNRAKLIMAKIATLLLSLSILTAIVSALAVFVQIPIINLKTGNLIDPFVATQTYSPIFSFVIFPVAVALLSLIAFGVGLIIRSSAVTTLTVIAYLFFTDVLIGTFCTIVMDNYDLGESIKRWFPNGLFERFCNGLFESHSVTTPVVPGSKQMITETTYNYSHLVFSSEFLAATAGIVAWVGVLVIIGTAIFKKRDV